MKRMPLFPLAALLFSLSARAELPAPTGGAADMMVKCAKCHNGEISTKFSFDNLATLEGELAQPGFPERDGAGGKTRGRLVDEILYRLSDKATSKDKMPKGSSVDEVKRAELYKYFLEAILPRIP